MNYDEFITSKTNHAPIVGIPDPPPLAPWLFPFQKDCVKWALRRGRAALFEDCGLGKGPQALEWSRVVAAHTGGQVLVVAPLAVAQQFIREGEKFGIGVKYAKDQSEADGPIVITNYERREGFDMDRFAGVALDESSILKAFDGVTRTEIVESCKRVPFRLACTATPAPNDYLELGNHAEFLGVMTRAEMLAMYFVHDGGSTQDWRIKGHAEDAFWQWVCSWAVMLRRPSDLGYEDGAFVLPPLTIHEHIVPVDHKMAWASGMLFKMEALTLDEQRAARRGTIDARVAKCAELVAANDGQWLVWCGLNDEGDALEKAIPGAVQVSGSDKADDKIKRALDFIEGRTRVLVSKAAIFGFGMNLQNAHHMAFVGIGHSYEQFYQAVRREWRFGQQHPVDAHVIIAETEGRVAANLRRKEQDAAKMAEAMVSRMRDIQNVEVRGIGRTCTGYKPTARLRVPGWLTDYAAQGELL